jgi:hypothetical protein
MLAKNFVHSFNYNGLEVVRTDDDGVVVKITRKGYVSNYELGCLVGFTPERLETKLGKKGTKFVKVFGTHIDDIEPSWAGSHVDDYEPSSGCNVIMPDGSIIHDLCADNMPEGGLVL